MSEPLVPAAEPVGPEFGMTLTPSKATKATKAKVEVAGGGLDVDKPFTFVSGNVYTPA